MSYFQLIAQGDAVSRLVALLLLGMSVASWVVILWKVWLLPRARTDVARSVAAFWQSASLADARQRLSPFDREALVLPLIAATRAEASGTLAAAGDRAQQLTRVLRDALHVAVNKLQYGQVLLATVGSTAPFVGLLGTVWGIYHALTSIASAGQITIDRVAGPVGEALIMKVLRATCVNCWPITTEWPDERQRASWIAARSREAALAADGAPCRRRASSWRSDGLSVAKGRSPSATSMSPLWWT